MFDRCQLANWSTVGKCALLTSNGSKRLQRSKRLQNCI